MQKVLQLALVFAVILAGCSAPDSNTQTTETTTVVPSTATVTPSEGDELAPGVTRDGIVNPVRLMNAHQQTLLSDGFVLNQTVRSTYNGTLSNRLVVVTTAGPGGEQASQNATSLGFDYGGNESITRNSVWLNTTAQISQRVEGGKTSYDVRSRLYPPEYLIWFGSLQRDIQFAAPEYDVTDVERRDGMRFVTLEAMIDRVGNDGINDTTSTIVVDENGVIRHAVVDVEYGQGNTYHTTYDVVQLGAAAPSPPAWLDTVPPSASLDVGMDIFEFDSTSVELVHTHGDAAPAGTIVTLVSNGTLYETTLAEPFGDGERYLWIASNGTLQATTDRPDAASVRVLDNEVTVTVRAPDGGELFSTSIGRR